MTGDPTLIRLTVTPAAYAMIVATLPENGGSEPAREANGDYVVWLAPSYVDQLSENRKPGESYSDVILRLAEASEGA